MPTKQKAKTIKKRNANSSLSKTKRASLSKKTASIKSSAPLLKAEDLGISRNYLVGRAMAEDVAIQSAPAVNTTVEVPRNLPIADSSGMSEVKVYTMPKMHRPLVGHRTSFWIGAGFGVFVVGVLALLAWQLLRTSVVEAVIGGLTGL